MWTTDNDHAAENQIHTGRHRLDEVQQELLEALKTGESKSWTISVKMRNFTNFRFIFRRSACFGPEARQGAGEHQQGAAGDGNHLRK